jgi:hypothetical protein
MVSANTARVFSSISFSIASGLSLSAKRPTMPCRGRMWESSVCVVP